jgi:hypothetical protein
MAQNHHKKTAQNGGFFVFSVTQQTLGSKH